MKDQFIDHLGRPDPQGKYFAETRGPAGPPLDRGSDFEAKWLRWEKRAAKTRAAEAAKTRAAAGRLTRNPATCDHEV